MSLAIRGARRLALGGRLAANRALSLFGHDDYVPFIILTRSRTGSNLLVSFLNGHPDIFCEGEIFAHVGSRDPISCLDAAFGRQPRRVLAKGFKIFYYHPLDADGSELWHRLSAMTDLRVIHLTRENVLRTLLSRKIAGLQDTWTATKYDRVGVEVRRVEFSVAELEEGFRQTREWERVADARFGGHKILKLTYEQIVDNPPETYAQMLAFLGMHDDAPATTLRKQNPESLGALISNYAALKAAFSGTEWAVYFDE